MEPSEFLGSVCAGRKFAAHTCRVWNVGIPTVMVNLLMRAPSDAFVTVSGQRP